MEETVTDTNETKTKTNVPKEPNDCSSERKGRFDNELRESHDHVFKVTVEGKHKTLQENTFKITF